MTIREYLFHNFTGCSNHDCAITGKKSGMGTNGQCHCLTNLSRTQLQILASRLSAIGDQEVQKRL